MSDSPRPSPTPPVTAAGTEATVVRKRIHLADAPVEPSGSLIGLKLGEYDVISQLGAGGMGIVYRGVQAQIGKSVAIKVLKPEIAAGTDSVQALLAEARAVNSIHHPGIVDIFSFGSTPDGRPYVVMELLEGASLDEVLRSLGRFQALEAIELLEQMLSALDAAHAAGVIHRDLKPANIHLTQLKDGAWRVKLLDFGLAKLTAPGASNAPQTQANIVRGTPEYMSPEQARAEPVSPQTDLYAIGVVAFELLTGELPFKAANPVELLMQHISATPPSPASLEPSVPPRFEELILQLLAKRPADRPESALGLRRDLLKLKKELIEGGTQIRRRPPRPRASAPRPALPAPEAPPTQQATPARRSNAPLIGGLVGVIALLVGGLVLYGTAPQPGPGPEPAIEVPTTPPPPVPVEVVPTTPPVPVPVPVEVVPQPPPALVNADPPEPLRPLPPRPKAKGHTADEVVKLLAELEAAANKRPAGEARSRRRALQEFRDELNGGGKPDQLWRQLKEYERNSQ